MFRAEQKLCDTFLVRFINFSSALILWSLILARATSDRLIDPNDPEKCASVSECEGATERESVA